MWPVTWWRKTLPPLPRGETTLSRGKRWLCMNSFPYGKKADFKGNKQALFLYCHGNTLFENKEGNGEGGVSAKLMLWVDSMHMFVKTKLNSGTVINTSKATGRETDTADGDDVDYRLWLLGFRFSHSSIYCCCVLNCHFLCVLLNCFVPPVAAMSYCRVPTKLATNLHFCFV